VSFRQNYSLSPGVPESFRGKALARSDVGKRTLRAFWEDKPGPQATGEIYDEVQTNGIGAWSCLIAIAGEHAHLIRAGSKHVLSFDPQPMAGLKKKSTSSYELMLPSGGSDRRRSGDLSSKSTALSGVSAGYQDLRSSQVRPVFCCYPLSSLVIESAG